MCLYLPIPDSEQREGKEPPNSPLSLSAVPSVGSVTERTSITVFELRTENEGPHSGQT